MNSQKTSIISYGVFIFAFVVVLINVISLVFPSLIITSISDVNIGNDPFELGAWGIPVVISNLSVLVIGLLAWRSKLPSVFQRFIKFVLNFEISPTIAIVAVVIIIFFYSGLVMNDLFKNEIAEFGDFEHVGEIAKNWPEPSEDRYNEIYLLHVKNFFLKSSIVLFDNVKIIPFLATVSLLMLTYFFTAELAKKRFAGIIAMVVLLQTHTFWRFDTIATYSNFWVLFYLLSLYLINKKGYFSPISYIASIFCKPLTAVYLPLTLFFIYRVPMQKRKKIINLIIYSSILVIIGIAALVIDVPLLGVAGSYALPTFWDDFWAGFTPWAFQLRFDVIFLLFSLPLTVGLFLASRKGIIQADSILFLFAGAILAMPLLAGLTGYNLHPYRYIPTLVVFAIGVGVLFSKRPIKI